MTVMKFDTDTSECDPRNGQNLIDDKGIVEDLLSKEGWEHLDFDILLLFIITEKVRAKEWK